MVGEAPHLLDPEVLDSSSVPDGKQRGCYYVPSSQGRSPESAAEFVDSIFEAMLPPHRPLCSYRSPSDCPLALSAARLLDAAASSGMQSCALKFLVLDVRCNFDSVTSK